MDKLFSLSSKALFYIYIALILLFALVYFFLKSDFNHDDFGFVESMYLSVVTITTLGYGDITPNSDILKIATSAQAFLGIMCFGLFLNSIANKVAQREDEFAKLREKEQWRPVLKEIMKLCQSSNVGAELLLNNIFQLKLDANLFNHITKDVENKLSRIEKLVQSSVVGLGDKTPKLFLLMDDIEQLKIFSHFLMFTATKKDLSKTVFCSDPVELIEKNRLALNTLKSELEVYLEDEPNEQEDIVTIRERWLQFKKVNKFNDDPTSFKSKNKVSVTCLNTKVAVQLDLPVGSQVHIFDTQTS